MPEAPEFVPAPEGQGDQALGVQTLVVYERGQWAVYLDVMFPGETRRFYIQSYRSERLAQIAATYVLRYADNDRPRFLGGR